MKTEYINLQRESDGSDDSCGLIITKSKTIKEWLQELPEPYRSEALENLENFPLKNPNIPEKVKYIAEAINYGFDWQKTKQGYDYWSDCSLSASKGIFDKYCITSLESLLSQKEQEIKDGLRSIKRLNDWLEAEKKLSAKKDEELAECRSGHFGWGTDVIAWQPLSVAIGTLIYTYVDEFNKRIKKIEKNIEEIKELLKSKQ